MTAVAAPTSVHSRVVGARMRMPCTDEVHGVDDADHHQHEPQQVEERQQARVPQQADDRQAVAGEVHRRHQREAHDAQPRAGEVAFDDAADEADQREAADDDVPERC